MSELRSPEAIEVTDQSPPSTTGRQGARRSPPLLFELVLLVVTAAIIAVVLRTFVAQAFSIPSGSMVPQLEVGDRVVVSKLAYRLHGPNRGDVAVFDCPADAGCVDKDAGASLVVRGLHGLAESVGLRQPSTEEYIKRVTALPGEMVEGRDGHIFVDGQRLIEPYLPASAPTSDFGPVRVPDGHVWVMGDNRANSSDSRIYGPIEADTVVGRATLRIWPPTRTAFL